MATKTNDSEIDFLEEILKGVQSEDENSFEQQRLKEIEEVKTSLKSWENRQLSQRSNMYEHYSNYIKKEFQSRFERKIPEINEISSKVNNFISNIETGIYDDLGDIYHVIELRKGINISYYESETKINFDTKTYVYQAYKSNGKREYKEEGKIIRIDKDYIYIRYNEFCNIVKQELNPIIYDEYIRYMNFIPVRNDGIEQSST